MAAEVKLISNNPARNSFFISAPVRSRVYVFIFT
ncbi:hypothetical protein BMS_1784 [Halobacteriovorax marinus SJ]|uniref:Uncharacterized protein n=1 Tax=Halobacteriovorax marinus (strain ATCC BAA-682 / DSM 15412 / SJ) TaxID=862908 RepID=E1X1U9_HALMS|nr:hypothetical protein BMS_1784 [Halobacteriovorax marinus SJ]